VSELDIKNEDVVATRELYDDHLRAWQATRLNAARAAARRQFASAYLMWQASRLPSGGDALDDATAAASLEGAEW
jgi:hypothetical protein